MPGMGGAAPTAAATVAVPVAQLLQRLASHIPLMGVCLTRAGSEVAVVTPAGAKHGHAADWWQHPGAVQHVAGGHLTSDALLKLVMEHKVQHDAKSVQTIPRAPALAHACKEAHAHARVHVCMHVHMHKQNMCAWHACMCRMCTGWRCRARW